MYEEASVEASNETDLQALEKQLGCGNGRLIVYLRPFFSFCQKKLVYWAEEEEFWVSKLQEKVLHLEIAGLAV